jgi:raffinose/stachyose/melibiose transport system substrate-binding protein
MYRSMTRRSFITSGGKAVIGASFAGSLLASCGGQEGDSGELTYWSALEGAGPREYYKQHIEKPFEKANPGIDLTVQFQSPEDLDRTIRTALQGGEGPDLVTTPGPSFALEYIDANLFVDLDEYAKQYGWQDKILGWALDSGRFQGKLYSVPTEFETMLLYYNKSLFEEKGWKPPQDREELESLAEEAQGQGIIPFSAGSADWRPTPEWFMTIFWNHYSGPDALYQALTGEVPWTDPVFVEAVDLHNRYFQNGWYGGSVEKFFSTGDDARHTQLGDGEAAMNMEGSWFLFDIDNFFGQKAGNDNEWAWAPLPSLRNGVPLQIFELGIGSTLSINQRSQVPDAAAKYINWLFSDPERAAQRMADVPAVFNIPIPLEREDFPSNMDPRVADVLATLSETTSEGNYGYTTWTFWPPKSDVFVYEGMEKVLTGEMEPAAYCDELNKTFQQELDEGEVPPIIERGTA